MALRLLLGVDDSPYARAATDVALRMRRAIPDSTLTALHVVNVVAPSGSFLKDLPGRLGFEPAVVPPELEEQYDEEARRLLGQVKLKAEEMGVEVRTVLDRGAVLERIRHHAEHADLLFIGSRGHTETRFPGQGGSNVYNIVSGVGISTVLVPTGKQGIHGIVVGYDGSTSANRVMASVRRVADVHRFACHVVYVDTGGGDPSVLDEVERLLPDADVHKHVVEHPSVREGLVETAQEVGADLIAIGFSGKRHLRDFLVGSAAEYLMDQKSLMVMIAR